MPQPSTRVADPVVAARAAGLRYVTDREPGIRRRHAGAHFSYIGLDGRPIHDVAVVRRIKALAIPPAYQDVWICADPDGHLQATGRDARGRKQYRYHPRWRAVRDETKYEHMLAFGHALPRLRARVEHDLALPGLPREKVLATVVRLLETTLIRVGNDEYARDNGSFGLTTLRDRHVSVRGTHLRFTLRGKSGQHHTVELQDRRLARIVQRCKDLPGYELFQYIDEQGQHQRVDSGDVNDYLHASTGAAFTAKDFRTWAGTVLAGLALQECQACDHATPTRQHVVQAIERVAQRLGNTPAVCRKCYIHPEVIGAYLDGSLLDMLNRERAICNEAAGLRPEEAALLEVLQQRASRDLTGHASA